MRLRYDERRQIGPFWPVVPMLRGQRVADLFGCAGWPQSGELNQIQDCEQAQDLVFVEHFGSGRKPFHFETQWLSPVEIF